ncbi:ParB/RepB/Spo0J family partition protein [Subtercola vilae]|uniref:ParB-like N-terminal domain-containing protein n=1 Tax=Subtercola vilae TaxID=2056433 RepID=A0A4T2BQB0_9MICO|nr:ParB/RepB/Spo0J family partition protein [Subtercola vilae]TIH33795.1 hypothetical protein D4765_14020 [Subtercola vilae]
MGEFLAQERSSNVPATPAARSMFDPAARGGSQGLRPVESSRNIGAVRTEQVPVARVHGGTDQPDSVVDARDVARMAASLEAYGQLHPISLDFHYGLIFGRVRLAAARQLRWETISARVFEDIDPKDVETRDLLRWEENQARSTPSLEQQADLVKSLQPALAEREKRVRRINGDRLNMERWGGPGTVGNLPTPMSSDERVALIIGEGKLPASIQAALDRPGSRREIIERLVPASEKTVMKYEKIRSLHEDLSLPAPVRDELGQLVASANESGKVDGYYNKALRIVEEYRIGADGMATKIHSHLISQLVNAVTLAEEKIIRVKGADVVDAIGEDPLAAEDWDGVLASAQRLIGRLDQINTLVQARHV